MIGIFVFTKTVTYLSWQFSTLIEIERAGHARVRLIIASFHISFVHLSLFTTLLTLKVLAGYRYSRYVKGAPFSEKNCIWEGKG